MRTYEDTGSAIMAIPEKSQTDEEPRITCVIRDITNGQNTHPISVTLPASYLVDQLVNHVSKQYGYQPNSFKLLYERDHQMEEFDCMDRRLGDVLVSSNKNKKHKFTLTEVEDGRLPVSIQEPDSTISTSTTPSNLANVTVSTRGGVAFDDFTSTRSEATSDNASSYLSTYENSSTGSQDEGKYIVPSSSHQNLQAPIIPPSQSDFCGLVNQAMTCYLNSLLQTLFMTPEFRNALYSWQYIPGDQTLTPEEKCIPYQLQKLFLQMQTGNHRSVETTPVTRSFGWDSSHSWQQHDVQELCRVMFDALEINWKKTQQANLINELYQGKLKDYVKCLECKTESFREDAYLDIPLVIKPFGAVHAYPSVEAALNAFIAPEILDGNNQYQCDNCNKKCDAHKGLKFQSFPYLLTLQLKRFDFDYSTMNRIKLNDRMTFPQILDLNGLVDDDSMPPTPGINADGRFEAGHDRFSLDRGDYFNFELDEDYDSPETAQRLIDEKGEYLYELFSIMIHSGSAVGGHYYAYIKSFTDRLWYSFNDQLVSRITKEDIAKTYGGVGGSSRGSMFSSSYTSSTNAYMLMYRRIDPSTNSEFLASGQFPKHITRLIGSIEEEKEAFRRARQIEKCTCKIKTFIHHPTDDGKLTYKTLEIHKDTCLEDATLHAYNMFELNEGLVTLDCVRLVMYNSDLDSIEKSYNHTDTDTNTSAYAPSLTIGDILGGVKSYYNFHLMLEIKQKDGEWQQYRTGGVTYRVHLVDVHTGIVEPPVHVRTAAGDTVAMLKQKIAQRLDLAPHEYMRCVLERRTTEQLILLDNDDKPVRDISYVQGTKVYVDKELSETADSSLPFADSHLHRVLSAYQHSICVLLTVPSTSEIEHYLSRERAKDQARLAQSSMLANGEKGASNITSKLNRDVTTNNSDVTENTSGITNSTSVIADAGDITTNVNGITKDIDEIITDTNEVTTNKTNIIADSQEVTQSGHEKTNKMEYHNVSSNTENMIGSSNDMDTGFIANKISGETNDVSKRLSTLSINEDLGSVANISPNHHALTNESEATFEENKEEVDDDMPLGACAIDKVDDESSLFAATTSDHEEEPLPDLIQSHNSPVAPVGKDDSREDICWDYTSAGAAAGTSTGTPSATHLSASHPLNISNQIEEEEQSVFREESSSEIDSKSLLLTVHIDKRVSLTKLKRILANRLSVPVNHFKLHKTYSNNQEIECTSESEPLSMMGNEARMSVKLSRVLSKGEYKVKVYELHINSTSAEPFTFLMELVVTKGMSIGQMKTIISKELLEDHDRSVAESRLMLRKKTWKNPGAVHADTSRVEHEILMYNHCEMFMQVLEGCAFVESGKHHRNELINLVESETYSVGQNDMLLFIQQWKPSTYEFGPITQLAIPTSADVASLKTQLSVISGIPVTNVEIAKGRGTFPGDISALDAHTTGLDWNPASTYLTSWPLYIDCGSLILYRDKTEKLGRLTDEKRKEINLRESNSNCRPSGSSYSRKEKALKIYTYDDTEREAASDNGQGDKQPIDLD